MTGVCPACHQGSDSTPKPADSTPVDQTPVYDISKPITQVLQDMGVSANEMRVKCYMEKHGLTTTARNGLRKLFRDMGCDEVREM